MCRQVTCNSCGKPTWAGCGAHVEMALANVPQDKRCRCRETEQTAQPKPAKKKFGFF